MDLTAECKEIFKRLNEQSTSIEDYIKEFRATTLELISSSKSIVQTTPHRKTRRTARKKHSPPKFPTYSVVKKSLKYKINSSFVSKQNKIRFAEDTKSADKDSDEILKIPENLNLNYFQEDPNANTSFEGCKNNVVTKKTAKSSKRNEIHTIDTTSKDNSDNTKDAMDPFGEHLEKFDLDDDSEVSDIRTKNKKEYKKKSVAPRTRKRVESPKAEPSPISTRLRCRKRAPVSSDSASNSFTKKNKKHVKAKKDEKANKKETTENLGELATNGIKKSTSSDIITSNKIQSSVTTSTIENNTCPASINEKNACFTSDTTQTTSTTTSSKTNVDIKEDKTKNINGLLVKLKNSTNLPCETDGVDELEEKNSISNQYSATFKTNRNPDPLLRLKSLISSKTEPTVHTRLASDAKLEPSTTITSTENPITTVTPIVSSVGLKASTITATITHKYTINTTCIQTSTVTSTSVLSPLIHPINTNPLPKIRTIHKEPQTHQNHLQDNQSMQTVETTQEVIKCLYKNNHTLSELVTSNNPVECMVDVNDDDEVDLDAMLKVGENGCDDIDELANSYEKEKSVVKKKKSIKNKKKNKLAKVKKTKDVDIESDVKQSSFEKDILQEMDKVYKKAITETNVISAINKEKKELLIKNKNDSIFEVSIENNDDKASKTNCYKNEEVFDSNGTNYKNEKVSVSDKKTNIINNNDNDDSGDGEDLCFSSKLGGIDEPSYNPTIKNQLQSFFPAVTSKVEVKSKVSDLDESVTANNGHEDSNEVNVIKLTSPVKRTGLLQTDFDVDDDIKKGEIDENGELDGFVNEIDEGAKEDEVIEMKVINNFFEEANNLADKCNDAFEKKDTVIKLNLICKEPKETENFQSKFINPLNNAISINNFKNKAKLNEKNADFGKVSPVKRVLSSLINSYKKIRSQTDLDTRDNVIEENTQLRKNNAQLVHEANEAPKSKYFASLNRSPVPSPCIVKSSSCADVNNKKQKLQSEYKSTMNSLVRNVEGEAPTSPPWPLPSLFHQKCIPPPVTFNVANHLKVLKNKRNSSKNHRRSSKSKSCKERFEAIKFDGEDDRVAKIDGDKFGNDKIKNIIEEGNIKKTIEDMFYGAIRNDVVEEDDDDDATRQNNFKVKGLTSFAAPTGTNETFKYFKNSLETNENVCENNARNFQEKFNNNRKVFEGTPKLKESHFNKSPIESWVNANMKKTNLENSSLSKEDENYLMKSRKRLEQVEDALSKCSSFLKASNQASNLDSHDTKCNTSTSIPFQNAPLNSQYAKTRLVPSAVKYLPPLLTTHDPHVEITPPLKSSPVDLFSPYTNLQPTSINSSSPKSLEKDKTKGTRITPSPAKYLSPIHITHASLLKTTTPTKKSSLSHLLTSKGNKNDDEKEHNKTEKENNPEKKVKRTSGAAGFVDGRNVVLKYMRVGDVDSCSTSDDNDDDDEHKKKPQEFMALNKEIEHKKFIPQKESGDLCDHLIQGWEKLRKGYGVLKKGDKKKNEENKVTNDNLSDKPKKVGFGKMFRHKDEKVNIGSSVDVQDNKVATKFSKLFKKPSATTTKKGNIQKQLITGGEKKVASSLGKKNVSKPLKKTSSVLSLKKSGELQKSTSALSLKSTKSGELNQESLIRKQQEAEQRKAELEQARVEEARRKRQEKQQLVEERKKKMVSEAMKNLKQMKNKIIDKHEEINKQRENEQKEKQRRLNELHRQDEERRKQAEELKEKEQKRLKLALKEKEEKWAKKMEEKDNEEKERKRYKDWLETQQKNASVAKQKTASETSESTKKAPVNKTGQKYIKGHQKQQQAIQQYHNNSDQNYSIDNLKCDEETDDECDPKKPVPKWATEPYLSEAIRVQYSKGLKPSDIFSLDFSINLSACFNRVPVRYKPRTSSAIWDSPPGKINKDV